MEKSVQNEYQKDEIDLYEILIVVRKRWLLILLMTLIFTAVAVSYLFLTPKIYKISNILLVNQVQDGDFISQNDVIEAIAILDKSKDCQNDVKINPDYFKYIVNMQATGTKGSTALEVEIDTRDSQAGVAVMESLPGYLSSNPAIISKINMNRSLLQKSRDYLKAVIDNPLQSLKLPQNTIVFLPSDIYTLREKFDRLNFILGKMDEKQQFISLAWKSMPPTKPYKPRVPAVLLAGFFIGLFTGTLGAFFVEWGKNSRNARMD